MGNLTLYNSSAGSGKTYTLVKEYLKKALAEDQFNTTYYKHILAVTFTNKAAAEMKNRVIKALKEIASKQPLNGTTKFLLADLMKEKSHGGLGLDKNTIEKRCALVLRSILHNYNDLAISTIDKFTHKIIRTFANDLHLPLNFEINLDEAEILSKAIDILIAQVGKNNDLTKLLINYSLEKANDEKSWQIEEDLKQFSSYLLIDSNEFYLKKLNHLSISDFKTIRDELKTKITAFENDLKNIAKKNSNEINELGIEHNSFYSGFLPRYYENLQTKVLTEPNNTIKKIIDGEANWYAKKTSANQQQLIDSNKTLLIKQYNNIQDYLSNNLSDYIIHKNIFEYSYRLAVLNEIDKIVHEVKKENNVLNFSDFNKKISELIANEPTPFIYERLGEKYHHYFIDEFQDTSIVQWQNLLPLIDNALANNHFNMLVGDAKQSIYRFRGGEVEQIINLPNIISSENSNKNETFAAIEQSLQRNFKLENLSNNYRSKAEIVDFNNHFFRYISNNLPEKYSILYENLNQHFNEKNSGGCVSISFLESENKEELELNTLEEINQTISNLLADNYQLKDIAILTKERKDGVLIASHLIENGIHVISSESLLLKNSKEVLFIIHLFNYLLTPHNKEIQLFIIQFLIERNNLTDSLTTIFDPDKKDVLHLFLEKNNLSINTNLINKLSLYEITEYFINHFNLDKEINIYLQFFLEKIYEYTTKKGNSLANFLDWWNEKSNKFTIVIPEGIDAVKIMTIHKSKGLEFPVVIYPFANSSVIKSNKFLDFFWTPTTTIKNLPTALIPIKKELEKTKYNAIYQDNISRLTLDLINLLYVALTRSEDRLYIISSNNKKKENKDSSTNRNGSVNEYLATFCETGFLNKNSEFNYTYGNFNPKSTENTELNDDNVVTEIFSTITHNSWREKIKISYQAPKVWNVESPATDGAYGTLIHSMLAEINTIDDLDVVLNKNLNNGILNENDKNALQNQLQLLLNNPLIRPLFTDFDNVKNEKTILLNAGENYKPDRVVFKENSIYVVDYKTGEKSKNHIVQLTNYKNIIRLMYPAKQIIGYLLYINTAEVVEV